MSTTDVAHLLVAGDNAIAIALADGWYRGRMGFARRSAIYGDELAALAQLEVTTADGDHVITTGSEWTGGFGDILAAGIYDGTDLDLRLPGVRDASTVGFVDAAAVPVQNVSIDLARFTPRVAAPVRTIAELDAAIDRRAHTDRARPRAEHLGLDAPHGARRGRSDRHCSPRRDPRTRR